MPTRNVVITDRQQLVDSLVASGRHQNVSEALRDGLRLVEGREALRREKLRLLREAAQAGFDDVAAGSFLEMTGAVDEDAFWAGVNADVNARIANRSA